MKPSYQSMNILFGVIYQRFDRKEHGVIIPSHDQTKSNQNIPVVEVLVLSLVPLQGVLFVLWPSLIGFPSPLSRSVDFGFHPHLY